MHYHCEIIMPRTKDIGKAVQEILEPFSEHNEDTWKDQFWDWYVIGGRFTGTKELCGYDDEKLEGFYKALRDHKVTVSGLQCGKQEIKPASQIPLVDKLWSDFFPTEGGEIVPCPLFNHSSNQYDSNDLLGCDICLVEEIPKELTASRVIIAGSPSDNGTMEATFMLCHDQWNGVNHMPVVWDGKVKTVINKCRKHFKHYKKEYQDKILPKPDWLCVTVDYHC